MSRPRGLPNSVMSRLRMITTLVVFLMFRAGPGSAASGDGTAGGILARLPFGARSLALGGMHGTLRDAPAAMTANPAALAAAGPAAVEAGFHQSAEDTTYAGLAAAYAPLPWLTAGLTYASLGAGEIETWDAIGLNYKATLQEDRAIGAGAAAAWGPAAFGLALRHYQSTIVGIATGSALLADAGVRVRIDRAPPPAWDPDLTRDPNPNGLDISLAATGLLGSPDFGGAADAGPAIYRAGAALTSALGRAGSVLLASLDTPRETARLQAALGWEVRFPFGEFTAVGRAGGRFRRGSSTLGLGLGAVFRGVAIDYAFVTADAPFAATHHVSAGFHLDAFRRAQRPVNDPLDPPPPAGRTPAPTPEPERAPDAPEATAPPSSGSPSPSGPAEPPPP